MTRKVLWLLPASLAAVLASQWKDIARYLKIHQMSRGAPGPYRHLRPRRHPGLFRHLERSGHPEPRRHPACWRFAG
jgi:hypothetical protein